LDRAANDVKPESLPKSISTFIAEHINSVVELEALLLLYAHRERSWSASEIAAELRIDRAWPQRELVALCSKGILQCVPGSDPSYRFAPKAPNMESVVGELAAAYADRRVTIIRLIFSKPVDKLKTFGDAFRIRRDPGNG
jgi:hypothetical protein